MKTFRQSFKVQSGGRRPTFHTVTEKAREFVTMSEIQNGICVVFSRHTTCAVMIEEDAIDEAYTGLSYLQQDLTDVFEKLIPSCRREGQYMHPGPKMAVFAASQGEDKPEALNTDAHLRSSIIGRSETVPIYKGNLELGDYGHIYFIDFDQTRGREREVIVQIMGE